MDTFKFDIKMSVEENVKLFLALMKLVDKEMSELLIDNLDKMVPLPDQGPNRTAARVTFNKVVMEGLENLNKSKGYEE